MWQTRLMTSYRQLILTCCFYFLLMIITLWQFSNSELDWPIVILILLLVLEWWRSLRYVLAIKGEFVLFHVIDQIYWHHQRWYLIRKPLLLRYFIIINLKSRKNGKKRTLFLMFDSLHADDWRTLNYYCHNTVFT
ncbi:protein YgfX [Orbaceae bacterium ESL0727]|nr:protein YgfX [Orbaceae bacterium ESL0727]